MSDSTSPTAEITHLIAVDGGGTHTRVAVATLDGVELARAVAGPSGLINGVDSAWNTILQAIREAFAVRDQAMPALAQLAIGLGLAGVHNKQWAAEFANRNPGFGWMQLETDAYTTLLGAHRGKPGSIVALGTGSVGQSMLPDGTRREVGGWGFPCGDEASGAWLGLQAVNYAQHVLDHRSAASAFSDAVIEHCGGDRDAMFAWLASANQASYAQLAPLVVMHATHEKNVIAVEMMQRASAEIMKMIKALDSGAVLPFALCGSLAKSFEPYLPAGVSQRLRVPHGDAVTGALLMIQKVMKKA